MSIGDINSSEKGSGVRYNTGKPDFSYIPLETLEEEARVWMSGAGKYDSHQWMRGMPWSAPFSSMMRHISAWQRGEDLDPETGQSHMAHAICNARMLLFFAKYYPEGDDRFFHSLPKPKTE